MEHLFQVISQQAEFKTAFDDSSDEKLSSKSIEASIGERNILRVIRNRSTLGLCMIKDQHLLDYLAQEDTLITLMQLIFNRISMPGKTIEEHDSSNCTQPSKVSPQQQLASSTHVLSDEEPAEAPNATNDSSNSYLVTLDDIARALEIIRVAERAPMVLTNIISETDILRIPFQVIAAVYGFFSSRLPQLENVVVNPATDTEKETDCKIEVTKAFDSLLDICTLSVDNLPIFIDTLEQPLFKEDEAANDSDSQVLLIDVWLQLLLVNRAGSSFVRIVSNSKDKPQPLLDKITGFLSRRKVFNTLIEHLFSFTQFSCDSITNILLQSLSSQAPWTNTITLEFSRVFILFLLLTGNDLSKSLPVELQETVPTTSVPESPSLSLAFAISDILVHILRVIMFDAIAIVLDIADNTELEGVSNISLAFLEKHGYVHASSWTLFAGSLLPVLCTKLVDKLNQCIDSPDNKNLPMSTLLMLKTVARFLELTGNVNDQIDSLLMAKAYNCSSDRIFSILSPTVPESNSCGVIPLTTRLLGWDFDPRDLFTKTRYGEAGRQCDVNCETIIKVVIKSGIYGTLLRLMQAVPTATIVLFLCSRLIIIAAFYFAGNESPLIKNTLEHSGVFTAIAKLATQDYPDSITPDPVIINDSIVQEIVLPTKFHPYRFRTPLSVYLLSILRALIRIGANVTKSQYDAELFCYLALRESPSKPPDHVMTYSQLKAVPNTTNPVAKLLLEHPELEEVSARFLWLDPVGGNCYYKDLMPFSYTLLRLGISTYPGVPLSKLKEYTEKEPVFSTSQGWNINSNLSLKQNIVLGALRKMIGLRRGAQSDFNEVDFTSVYNGIISTSLDEDSPTQKDGAPETTERAEETADINSYLVENAVTELEARQEEEGSHEKDNESNNTADIISYAECLPEELEPPVELLQSADLDKEGDNVEGLPAPLGPSVCTAAKELSKALIDIPNEVTRMTRTPLRPALSDTLSQAPFSSDAENRRTDGSALGVFEQQITVIPLVGMDDESARSYSPPPIPKSASPPTGIYNRRSRGSQAPNKPLVAVPGIAARSTEEKGHAMRSDIRASNEYCNVPAEGGRFMTFEEASAMFEKQKFGHYQRGHVMSADSNEFRPLSKKMMANSSSGSLGRSRKFYGRS